MKKNLILLAALGLLTGVSHLQAAAGSTFYAATTAQSQDPYLEQSANYNATPSTTNPAGTVTIYTFNNTNQTGDFYLYEQVGATKPCYQFTGFKKGFSGYTTGTPNFYAPDGGNCGKIDKSNLGPMKVVFANKTICNISYSTVDGYIPATQPTIPVILNFYLDGQKHIQCGSQSLVWTKQDSSQLGTATLACKCTPAS